MEMNSNLIEAQLIQLQNLLEKLKEIDFGYPIGTNVIKPPSRDLETRDGLHGVGVLQDQLFEFYSSCDGISMPDVHAGYFLKSLDELRGDRSDPVRLGGS